MRLPKNESKNSWFVKGKLANPESAEVHATLGARRNFAKLVDRIEDFAATRVDLHWKDPKPCTGRPAGSRVEKDAYGRYVIV